MESQSIQGLLHLYEDGAFGRRELVQRLVKYTGSVAAAVAAVDSAGFAQTAQSCPDNVRVAENDPEIVAQMLTIHGDGPLYVYQTIPRARYGQPTPAVLVIHENRGLNEHIKDVTRRVARAGFIGLAVDLLSRQGGTQAFPDAETAGAAYGRTRPDERRQDIMAALLTIRDQSYVRGDRIGAVGFCAGGGNVMDAAVNTDKLAAVVSFYGSYPNPVDSLRNLTAPLLAIHAEIDRGINGGLPGAITVLNSAAKPYALHVYEGTGHAFHNDTGARYDAAAACDAWAKTIAFFNRHLNRA